MAHSKKATVMVGFVPIATRMEKAVDDESSGFHTVCTGNGEHDPVRVKQHVACPVCDEKHTSIYGFPLRGVERDGGVVVLTEDEIKAASGTPQTGNVDKHQPPVPVFFHPREKVYRATVAGDSVQNMYPDKGAEKPYTLLRDALKANPDVVACMIWAPSTKNALWVLEVVDERITVSKRCWPETVRPTLQIPPVDVAEMESQMFNKLVASTVEDFDLGRYVNQSRLGLEDLLAEREGTPLAELAGSGVSRDQIPDLLAKIQASLEAAGAKPVAAKKAPVKKVVAKKTAAKRSTPVKKTAAKRPAKKAAATPLAKAG